MNCKIFLYPESTVVLRPALVLLGLLVLLCSCATVQVSQDYDTHYLFDRINTYGWNETLQKQQGDLLNHDELLTNRFKKAIAETLAGKGILPDLRPDILVSYSYEVSERFEVDPISSNYGFGYGFGRFGHRYGMGIETGSYSRQYEQGKLVVYIHSAQTGHLLWKGTGTREIFNNANPEQISRYVNELVEAVLAKFPPLAK